MRNSSKISNGVKKIILGLVGETGSGKDAFSEYLKKKFKNVFVFRFSQPLTEALGIFFDKIKKEDQQWLANSLRGRFGNNILGEAIKKKIKNIKEGIVVLNGIRVWEEFRMIKRLGGKIVYITADSKIRWQRIKNRGEKKDDLISYQKFLKIEKNKTEILIPQIGKKADFKIENNGSKNNFYKECRKILTKVNLL
jgi:dephospho-CoA kinase